MQSIGVVNFLTGTFLRDAGFTDDFFESIIVGYWRMDPMFCFWIPTYAGATRERGNEKRV